MAEEWYVDVMGEPSGPYSISQMKQLVERKRVTPEMNVRQGDGTWILAASVSELFPQQQINQIQQQNETRTRTRKDRVLPVVTTPNFIQSGLSIERTLAVVTSRRIEGLNLFKDLATAGRDIFGGRSQTLERELKRLEAEVLDDLARFAKAKGAHAVVACRIEHSFIEKGNGLLMCVTGTGTPVVMEANSSGIEIEEEGDFHG